MHSRLRFFVVLPEGVYPELPHSARKVVCIEVATAANTNVPPGMQGGQAKVPYVVQQEYRER